MLGSGGGGEGGRRRGGREEGGAVTPLGSIQGEDLELEGVGLLPVFWEGGVYNRISPLASVPVQLSNSSDWEAATNGLGVPCSFRARRAPLCRVLHAIGESRIWTSRPRRCLMSVAIGGSVG